MGSKQQPFVVAFVVSVAAAGVLAQDATAPVVRARPPARPIAFEQTLAVDDTVTTGDAEGLRTAVDIVHDVTCSPAGDEKGTDAGPRVQLHYQRSRVEIETPIEPGSFDSNDGDPLSEETRTTVGESDGMGGIYALTFAFMGRRKLTVGLQPDGTASVQDGLDPVIDGIAGLRSTQFGPSVLEDTALRPEFLFLPLGDGPHTVGAKWEREGVWTAPVGGPRVRATVAYRVEAVDADTVTIAFGGEPELVLEWGDVGPDDRSPMPSLQKFLKDKLASHRLRSGAFAGKATVSRKDGLPVSLSWSLDLTQTFKTPFGDSTAVTKLTCAVKRE